MPVFKMQKENLFLRVSNIPVSDIQQLKDDHHEVSMVHFEGVDGDDVLELKIGFSFVVSRAR